MRAALVHPFFEELGGAEKLALEAAAGLLGAGWNVDIYTVNPPNIILVESLFGRHLARVLLEARLIVLRGLPNLGKGVRLRRLLVYNMIFRHAAGLRKAYDVVLETQSNLPAPVDISYMHYPAMPHYIHGRGPYSLLVKLLARRLSAARPGVVVTNSRWTASLILRIHGLRARVIYPPVDVDEAPEPRRKEPGLVVTLSRLLPEKRIDTVLDVAERLPSHRFVVMGSASTAEARRYAERLRARAERLGNVEVLVNPPRSVVWEHLGSATWYLHPMYPEHFGIAVAEAAATGAVPVVYCRGGAWTDIASRIDRRLCYRTVKEATEIIKSLASRTAELAQRARQVAQNFSTSRFRERIVELAQRVAGEKRRALRD